MSHPITNWFHRTISHPLTEMYARLDEHQLGEHLHDRATSDPDQQPSRPAPVDVSWMPMPGSHARRDTRHPR
ncbi:hypothetical protein D6T64_00055 [Cryobacterium melibiosiphilum]|uniref:Uncharacterized protein n=1 Tax=Cryobacterium melibiosiphilum TaxID=995039 RepID=A0A3A5N5Z7_9MICO|nr:hypothetical protein [Cryobacterium melibiosiphilum]RJT92614.1 hypothetical protein D6T64_00055 [Cryobacterium melibiosiphilum]